MERTMKAKMKDNLVKRYKELLPTEIDDYITEFLKSIEGKEVNLIFTSDDAFEENNNDIWLPDSLWVKTEPVRDKE